jgi:hypothetical protein
VTVQVEFWSLVMLLIAFFAACGATGKLLLRQFQRSMDQQFGALSSRLEKIEEENRNEASQWLRVERDLLKFQAELPMNYVRRDDYIRGQSILEAKSDGLAGKIDVLTGRLENIQLRAVTQQRGENP